MRWYLRVLGALSLLASPAAAHDRGDQTLIAAIADRATKPPMTGEDAIAEVTAKLVIAPEITTAIGVKGVVAAKDVVAGARMAKNELTDIFEVQGITDQHLRCCGVRQAAGCQNPEKFDETD